MSRLAILLPLAAFAAGGGIETAGRSQARTHTIEIRGLQFHPAVLTVARGDTVVWINRDIVPHTATRSSKGPIRWDTGSLSSGASGRYIPERAGVARYTCTFHP